MLHAELWQMKTSLLTRRRMVLGQEVQEPTLLARQRPEIEIVDRMDASLTG